MTNNNINGSGAFYANSFHPQAFNSFASQVGQSRGYVPEMINGPFYSDVYQMAQSHPAANFSQPFMSNAAIMPMNSAGMAMNGAGVAVNSAGMAMNAAANHEQQAYAAANHAQQAYAAANHAQQVYAAANPAQQAYAANPYQSAPHFQAHGMNASGISSFGQNNSISFAPVAGQQISGFGSNAASSNVSQQARYQNSHAAAWVPSINVIEANDSFSICAELAGVSEEQVEIYVQHNVVTIRGNKQATAIEQQQPVVFAERNYGPFIRTITLPVAVNNSKVKAVMRQGLLEIQLPKITQAEGSLQRVKVSGKA